MMTTQAIKERPILFSGPMVRAILAGRKTVTRRIVKPKHVDGIETCEGKFTFMHAPDCGGFCDYACAAEGEIFPDHIGWTPWGSHPHHWGNLWVKETWTPDHEPFYPHFPICYRADFGPEYDREDGKVFSSEQNAWFPFKWRPSIFMPRRVSRITLEIVSIYVERLNDITPDDVQREGFTINDSSVADGGVALLEQFARLWEKLNGKDSWAANPWVWVIEFKKVSA